MKYKFLTNNGALNEGNAAVSDDDIAGMLLDATPKRARSKFQSIRNLSRRSIPSGVVTLLPESVCRENIVIPIERRGATVIVAAADPNDIAVADKIRFLLGLDVQFVQAPAEEIATLISQHFGATEAHSVESMLCELTDTSIDFTESTLEDAVGRPAAAAKKTKRRLVRTRHNRPTQTEFQRSPRVQMAQPPSRGKNGMFHFTIDEGQRVLRTGLNGQSDVLVGPQRVWKGWNRFETMQATVAHPGEFLIVRFRDGRQEHVAGPTEVWFDRRLHESIEKEDALQVAANEAVVVYRQTGESERAERRVENGPQLFVPRPGEWLHTFQWHASDGGSTGVRKVPRGLVFQKLWLMPDQMYHDVPDVRTSDDAVLTIRLMIFFELLDVNQMLDSTHDPIGDFVNAATADVVGFTGRHDFESFKQHTDALNELDTYRHLTQRAEQSGYRITNVVYRGYGAPDSLQQMHDQAIEARTRLQLERATEEQSQQLEDFQLESQLARASRRRAEQADEVRHELELNRQKSESLLQEKAAQAEFSREQQQRMSDLQDQILQRDNGTKQAHLQRLKDMGVDLTSYLTHSRADEVIELRGGNGTAPHVHLSRNGQN